MGAWKDISKKAMIAKNGKKQGQLKIGLIPHKNKDCAGAGVETTASEQNKPVCKIKRPEGVYEITFGIVWKAQLKTKSQKKKPLPPTCKLDSVWEFTEIRIFVDKIKMPDYHTCQIEVSTNIVQNSGSAKDMVPEASFYLDIWTGHMVMGKWHKLLKNVYFSGESRKNKMRIHP